MSVPPRDIPSELYDKYTLNKTISVFDWYIDERTPVDKTQTLIWTDDYIQSYINRFTFENIANKTFGGEGYLNASRDHAEVCKKYKDYIEVSNYYNDIDVIYFAENKFVLDKIIKYCLIKLSI
jgi:hypothetical protein